MKNIQNTIKVLLAPTLELANTVTPQISVEAEYGDTVVEGSRYTAAHHGSRSGNPCPCVDGQIPLAGEGDTILVSHIDLDTLGGVGQALGLDPDLGSGPVNFPAFWDLAAFVDVNGPHKLGAWQPEGVSEHTRQHALDCIHTYWAWAQSNRGPRRDAAVHDVTQEVQTHLNILSQVLWESGEERPLRKAGQEFKKAGEALSAESFRTVARYNGHPVAIVRVSDSFVNHLYTTPQGEVVEAVVAFNSKTKAVTLSFAEKDDPRNAAELMKKAFGPDAGGHRGIAGSPRGVELEAEASVAKVIDQLLRWELIDSPAAEEGRRLLVQRIMGPAVEEAADWLKEIAVSGDHLEGRMRDDTLDAPLSVSHEGRTFKFADRGGIVRDKVWYTRE